MAAMTGILQGLSNALSQHITYMQQKKLQDEDRAFRQAMQREGFAHQAQEGRLTREAAAREGVLSRTHAAEQGKLGREHSAEQGRLGREHTSSEAERTRIHASGEAALGRTHASTEASKTRTHQSQMAEDARIHSSTEAQKTRTQQQQQHAERMTLQQQYYELNKKRVELQMERDPLERQKIQAQIDHLEALVKSLQAPKTAAFQSMRPEVRTAATDIAYGLGQSIVSKVYRNEEERKQALQYEGALAYQRLLQVTGGNVAEAQRALAAIWEHTAATEEMRNYAGKIERDPTRRSQLLHVMGNEFIGGLAGTGMDLTAAQAEIKRITDEYNARQAAQSQKTPEQQALEAQSVLYMQGLVPYF